MLHDSIIDPLVLSFDGIHLVALSILFLEELNYRFIFKMQNLEVCYTYELATLFPMLIIFMGLDSKFKLEINLSTVANEILCTMQAITYGKTSMLLFSFYQFFDVAFRLRYK